MKQINYYRRELDFNVGDKIFIIKKIQFINRPSDKLDYLLIRTPYKILAIKGYLYKLEVPKLQKGFKVFYINRLRKDANNPLPGQINENLIGEIINNEEEQEVEDIVTYKLINKQLKY